MGESEFSSSDEFVRSEPMGISVQFSPSNINFGVIPPGSMPTQTVTCGILSSSANVTPSIVDDTSGGVVKVKAMRSYIEVQVIEPGGGGPAGGGKPVKIETAKQVGEWNGATSLAVVAGQFL